jgi:hypothetical protein
MATFMQSDMPASMMVTNMGEVIENVINLKGEPVGPRNRDGPTVTGAHYGNADADGNYVVAALPSEADWFFQSLCSAHLEQKYQVRTVYTVFIQCTVEAKECRLIIWLCVLIVI